MKTKMTKITTRTITGKYLHKPAQIFWPPAEETSLYVCVCVQVWIIGIILYIVCKHYGQHASIITGPKFSHKMRRAT